MSNKTEESTAASYEGPDMDLLMSINEGITLGQLKAAIARMEASHPLKDQIDSDGVPFVDKLPVVMHINPQQFAETGTASLQAVYSQCFYNKEFIILDTDHVEETI